MPTSLLDVSSSYEAATAFAFEGVASNRPKNAHIRVFATPKPTTAVNPFYELEVCVVDLVAELPSYCLRPHVQRAAFIANITGLLSDLSKTSEYTPPPGCDLDDICIAHVRLEGKETDYLVNARIRASLRPKASTSCKHCLNRRREDDLSGDLLFHKLGCLSRKDRPTKEFPK
jgi:hypothetical protein